VGDLSRIEGLRRWRVSQLGAEVVAAVTPPGIDRLLAATRSRA
jgi:hypothetical protein